MYSGKTAVSDNESDKTVIDLRKDPDIVSRQPKVGPYLQIDLEPDEDGEFVVKSVMCNESEFGSTVPHPTFKIPEAPRKAIRISDRFQLVDPKPPTPPKPSQRKTIEKAQATVKPAERKPDAKPAQRKPDPAVYLKDAQPFGMELTPSSKPAVLGLNDLSGVRLHNFNPRKAFKNCLYPSAEDRHTAKKNGLVFKMVTRRTYSIENAPGQCFKGESVCTDLVPISWDGDLELDKKTSSVQNFLSRY